MDGAPLQLVELGSLRWWVQSTVSLSCTQGVQILELRQQGVEVLGRVGLGCRFQHVDEFGTLHDLSAVLVVLVLLHVDVAPLL